MTVQDAISGALNRLASEGQQADAEYPYDTLTLAELLPFAELAQYGLSVHVLQDDDADVLPRLLVQNTQGQVEVERSPFASLVLVSGGNSNSVSIIRDVFSKTDFVAVTVDDFIGIPDWHGFSPLSWLFPERLSEAFSLLDTLRRESGG